MNNTTFAGISYPTRARMISAACQDWICAGGLNSVDTVLHWLRDETAETLAADMFDGWCKPDDECDVELSELVAEFKAMKAWSLAQIEEVFA